MLRPPFGRACFGRACLKEADLGVWIWNRSKAGWWVFHLMGLKLWCYILFVQVLHGCTWIYCIDLYSTVYKCCLGMLLETSFGSPVRPGSWSARVSGSSWQKLGASIEQLVAAGVSLRLLLMIEASVVV